MIEVSLEKARQFILDVQGLHTSKPCKSIISVARRIHNIQIDTISVISRSHNITTFNRYEKYKEGQIWDKLKAGKLFEFWSHAMCLMPIETYPFYSKCADVLAKRTKGWRVEWGVKNPAIVKEVYEYVKKNGATASRNIGTTKSKGGGWWSWKAEKHALDYLFNTGRLMVSYREGFQKYYDLTERVLPSSISSEPLSDDDATWFSVETAVRSLGIACWKDVRWYTNGLWSTTKAIRQYLDCKVKEGLLEVVSIEEIKEPHYILHKDRKKLDSFKPTDKKGPMKFLCPFDNVIRERSRPQRLWSFEYKLEAYTPPSQRKYGYYILPILHGTHFIGRMDSKVHRDKNEFEVKALSLESNDWDFDESLSDFKKGLDRFAKFHNCEIVTIGKVSPKKMTSRIRSCYE